MEVVKRNNSFVDYDLNKIKMALTKAFNELDREFVDEELLEEIDNKIHEVIIDYEDEAIGVEDIQDIVEDMLMVFGYYEEAKEYIKYRYKRTLARECKAETEILEMIDGDSEYWTTENSNKDARLAITQRDYIAGIMDTKIAREFIFPKEAVKAHDEGIIHIHELFVA